MTNIHILTHRLLLLFSGALLLAACSPSAQPTATPARKETKYNYRLSAVWYPSQEKPEELLVEYWIQNQTKEDASFEFSNSGRVCGLIQTPDRKELVRFPEAIAQVVGTEQLKAGFDRTFKVHVPRAELAALEPGRYEVKGWLCGYEDLSAWAEFFVHAPAP